MYKSNLFLFMLGVYFFTGCSESDKKKELEWEWDETPKERLVEVIAHRGAMGYELENSLAAFKKAAKMGSDYVELDIWRTTDDTLVVIHDRDTERLTGKKLVVPHSSYAQLRALRLSNGERIPTLREVLTILPDTMGVFVEIKCTWEPGPAGKVIPQVKQVLEETGFIERATINSFDPTDAAEVDEHLPDLPFYVFSYTREPAETIVSNAVKYKCDGVNLSYLLVDETLVTLARQNDLKVYVWGVNTAKIAGKMLDLKVDGITTDYPDRIIDAVTR